MVSQVAPCTQSPVAVHDWPARKENGLIVGHVDIHIKLELPSLLHWKVPSANSSHALPGWHKWPFVPTVQAELSVKEAMIFFPW